MVIGDSGVINPNWIVSLESPPSINSEPESIIVTIAIDTEKRYRGKITGIDGKGFGFIVSLEIPFTRIFFHWSHLNQQTKHFTELHKGDTVEFNAIVFEDKGIRAIKITVLESVKAE